MNWKVFNINTGRIIKARFGDEESAREWLEGRDDLEPSNYMVEEMDPDEEEQYFEAHGEDDDIAVGDVIALDEDEDTFRYNYHDDGDFDDNDEDLFSEFEPDEE